MTVHSQQKVIVGMSGGVDSSVAAYLLLQQGYEVEGLFMKNWEEDDDSEYCAAAEDLKDAQQVADKLGIKLHQINFAAEYWDNVFEHFLEEYKAGRTPNPDIMCNKEIKFKAFLEFAAEDLGADFIATGHYVRNRVEEQDVKLLRGIDDNKDQSYFLHALTHQQVGKTLFPIGDLPKSKVREIALEQGFVTHDKKDSTGICFIGERKFKDFLGQYIPAQPGVIETTEGEAIGEHQGLMFHTLGQRKGLYIGGTKDHGDEAWYVVGKDIERNVLIVAQGANHPSLYSKGLIAKQLNWVAGQAPATSFKCVVKTRYRQQDIPCEVTMNDEGDVMVEFEQAQKAVTPGQSAVFYVDEVCLGGGIIEQAIV